MKYRGFQIDISICPDRSGLTFHAFYAIVKGLVRVNTGTIEGGLTDIRNAEQEAFEAARRWIEQNRATG